MNPLSKKPNHTNRRSARLLAAQSTIDVGGEPSNKSQTFTKRKRTATNDTCGHTLNDLPAPKKKKTPKESVQVVDIDPDYESTGPSKGTQSKRGSQPEPVYIIPDVEKKETTFKGRLGRYLQFHGTIARSLYPQVMHA